MKKLITLFTLMLFGYGAIIAQVEPPTAKQIRALMWDSSDKDFNVTEIPDKWKNESAVVICQEIKSDYDKYGIGSTKLKLGEHYHKRVKLLDKAAIEEYSEFSFAEKFTGSRGRSTKSTTAYFGIKVVKADGKEEIVDISEAVDIEGDGSSDEKKIAIPNLEEGDIVDYYFYTEEAFVVSKSYQFQPAISTLNEGYSIMKQRFEFIVEKNFYINFKSLNGAPKLQVREDSENKKIIYTLVDENRDKITAHWWNSSYQVYPTIKFQVVYSKKNATDDLYAFLGESGKAKTSVSAIEVADFIRTQLPDVGITIKEAQKSVVSYLARKGMGKKTASKRKLEEAYYYLRHRLYNKTVERNMSTGSKIGVNEIQFAQIMTYLLKKWDVPHEVLVVAQKRYTGIEDVIFFREVSLVVKANFDKPVYLSNFDMNSVYGELPKGLESAEAYIINLKDRKAPGKKIIMPASTYEENQVKITTNVRFDEENLKVLKLERKQEIKGLSRHYMQDRLVNFLDFIVKDAQRYNIKSMFDLAEYYFAADVAKLKDIIDKRKQMNKEALDEFMEESIEDEFNVDELASFDGYEILESGRTKGRTELVFTENFSLDGFVKKAGKNYLLEVGQLIGDQINLDEEDRERTIDVYMPYARSYQYDVTIEIPEGYAVQGLDKLNKTVENETGGFTSSATLEGNTLSITTFKYYAHNFEKVGKWGQMQEFLDATQDFLRQKVLLKRVASSTKTEVKEDDGDQHDDNK